MKSRSSSVEHVDIRRPIKLKSKIDLATILGLHVVHPKPKVSHQLLPAFPNKNQMFSTQNDS